MFKMCVLKKEPCLVKYDNLSIVLLSRSVFSRGLWSLKYDFLQHNKKDLDDPVYRLIKTNFKKEKQTFDIYFSFPKSFKIILDLCSETRMKFKSWWQVIWMNKIWRTPKILRHFLLKQVLVFACPWINKNVPLVRSNSLVLKNLQDLYYRRAMSVRRKHESVPPRLILKRRFQLKKSISRQENIEKKV